MDTVDVPKCCGDETIKQQPNPTVSCTCRDRLVLERQHRRGVAAVQRRGTPCFKQLQCVLYLIIIIKCWAGQDGSSGIPRRRSSQMQTRT
jgi:hypothetical protein